MPHPDRSLPSDWLTTTEVAELLRVHPKHVYRLLQTGMPARRVGGQWRFSRDEVQRWAEQRSQAAASRLEAPAVATPSLVALESNEVGLAVARSLGMLCPDKAAVVHTSGDIARDLLMEGRVAAALMPDLHALPFTTLRIHLATRHIGLLARSRDALRASLATVAVAPCATAQSAVATWLDDARSGGASIVEVDSELDACSLVLNKQADVALASGSWAERLAFRFRLLGTEHWDLVLRAGALEDPCASGLCLAAQDNETRESLRHALGCEDEGIGRMRLVPQAASENAADDTKKRSRYGRTQRRGGAPRWMLLRHERAEQMLHFVQELRRRGLRVGGFLQLPAGPASSKPLGYDLYRIAQPERIPFAERIDPERHQPSGQRFCQLAIHAASLDHAWDWLRQDSKACDLLVFDGIGALEHGGKGFFPALAWARTLPPAQTVIISSRRKPNSSLTDRLALAPDRVTALSLASQPDSLNQVAEQVLHACGRRPQRSKHAT